MKESRLAPSSYRTLRLCSGGGGFEAIPRTDQRLDLPVVSEGLRAAGIEVVDARVMLIASFEAEATISASGRILIKTNDAALAQRVFERVVAALPTASLESPPRRPRSG
ncbi:MAG: hypothetical protein WBG19_07215 [Thermoplasmata archaeon]